MSVSSWREDQEFGHRIHGGWAELPCQWQDGHGAPHVSQSVMIKSREMVDHGRDGA